MTTTQPQEPKRRTWVLFAVTGVLILIVFALFVARPLLAPMEKTNSDNFGMVLNPTDDLSKGAEVMGVAGKINLICRYPGIGGPPAVDDVIQLPDDDLYMFENTRIVVWKKTGPKKGERYALIRMSCVIRTIGAITMIDPKEKAPIDGRSPAIPETAIGIAMASSADSSAGGL